MTTQLPSKEKVQWLHDTATEFASVGMKLTLNAEELLSFTSALLAAYEQEPYWWAIENRHGDARFVEEEHAKNNIWDEVHELNERDDNGEYFEDNAPYKVVPVYRGPAIEVHKQEAVSFDALRDAVAEMTGGRPMDWREGDSKGHQVVPFINFNSLSRIVEKFRTHPAPSIPDQREAVRKEHAEWSQATFGNVGPIGPLKHLSKEALEAAADPSDALEWADMQFLLWDAQRRMGISDEFITRAMIEKLAINKARTWPEPRDGEPRLHLKDSAPSIPAAVPDLSGIISELEKVHDWILNTLPGPTKSAVPNARRVRDVLAACRAAMLQSEPDGWIPVSERLPDAGEDVVVAKEFYAPGDWRKKVGHIQESNGAWRVYGATWIPTHWQPLPAAPKGV